MVLEVGRAPNAKLSESLKIQFKAQKARRSGARIKPQRRQRTRRRAMVQPRRQALPPRVRRERVPVSKS